MNRLEKRVVDISYQNKLAHLSSTLNAVNIIEDIYKKKQQDEPFILSSGHAALALYVVLESYEGLNAVELFFKHGVHPHRNLEDCINVSTGSLGMGITVAVGYALANRDKKVHVLISDGESNEGSVWEALRFIHEHKIDNLEVYANVNGMIAYDMVDKEYTINRLKAFLPRINIYNVDPPDWSFAKGVLTHYYVLKEEDYEEILR